MHEVIGIVHRDIKPDNIIMMAHDNDSNFKLVDFGLAQYFSRDNLNIRCGSPGYVAPEILKSLNYGPKVDVFSIGIILYIVLSGRSPF